MKITTNFTFPYHRLVSVLVGLGWSLVLLAVGLGAFLVVSASHFRNENPGLTKKLQEINRAPAIETKTVLMPSADNLDNLKSRLKGLNAMDVGMGRSLASVLARLEKLLPGGARLLSFQGDQSTQEIQLMVEAENLDDLSKFLSALENDSSFSKVNLTKQSRSANDKKTWVQFSVDMIGSPR